MADFEYVIVGSGVAGATVAQRLLQANPATSILMLEAGPEVEAKNRRYWWDYLVLNRQPYAHTYDQPGETQSRGNTSWLFEGSRVNAYGGSTVHWGGWSLRFKPEDFQLHTNTGQGGDWPLGYDDLEPYYGEAEQLLSVCGDDGEEWGNHRSTPFPRPPFWWTEADGEMIGAFLQLGIKPGKMPIARYRKCMTTGTCKYCPIGSRFSAQLMVDDLRADERFTNFEVRSNAPATQILMSAKERATGVEYLDKLSGESVRVGAGVVLVAAGAYESPKLLNLSTSSHWKDGIGNDHDLLGRYVVSHSMLIVTGRGQRNDERWLQEYDFPTLMSRTYDTTEEQEKGKIFLFKNRAKPNVDLAALMIAGKSRKAIDETLRGPRLQQLQAFLEEKGRYENRLTLAPGRSRIGLPKTQIVFDRSQEVRDNAQDRLKLMESVIKAMGYTVTVSKLRDPGGHHTTGTCRMGKTPEEGVTDLQMRVFGTENLYVCSNAAFPSGSAVNPTLTLVAMALRLGDHLLEAP